MSVNTVTIEGNAVRDPELRFSQAGNAVCGGSLAYNERVRDEKGEWTDGEPTYVDWVCFKELAENVAETVTKGQRIVVTGRLQMDRWEDKNSGENRSKLKIVAESVTPSLRWATADITKTSGRKGGKNEPTYDANEEPF